MFQLILLIILLGVVAAIASLVRQWWARRNGLPTDEELPIAPDSRAEGCCGMHETCEKDSLLAAVSNGIEYYEDEELDRFIGHSPEGYSEAEIEEFNEVLTTLRSEEVAGWVRSLQLRGIGLPFELKDDVLLLVGERREH